MVSSLAPLPGARNGLAWLRGGASSPGTPESWPFKFRGALGNYRKTSWEDRVPSRVSLVVTSMGDGAGQDGGATLKT